MSGITSFCLQRVPLSVPLHPLTGLFMEFLREAKKRENKSEKSGKSPQCFIGITNNVVRQPVTVEQHVVLLP